MVGMINVYKERDFTSNDVVAKLRGILKFKKIGHTGTLDPMAEGVLPVCLGKATKLCDMLMDDKKEYVARFILGIKSDTQDVTGNIEAVKAYDVKNETKADGAGGTEDTCAEIEKKIKSVAAGFIGEQEQLTPMYSARKVAGKKLYEYARAGVEVERPKKKITIFDISDVAVKAVNACDIAESSKKFDNVSADGNDGISELLNDNYPGGMYEVSMRVLCSKGTYIRTLCHDIGEALGCGGCMSALTRTKTGIFTLENALKLGEIEELAKAGRIDAAIIDPETVFLSAPKLDVEGENVSRVNNGNYLEIDTDATDDLYFLKDGNFVRIYIGGSFNSVYEKDGKRLKHRISFV